MTFVFYDTETTGLDAAFDQIVQFAAIVTDDDFNPIEELNLRCRLQPHVVPSPGAINITRVGPRAIQAAPLSLYKMVGGIREFIERWTPATFLGFNSIDFDEKMLRGAFYQTLHPAFLTNTNGNTRMDVLRLAHAVAALRPDAIKVPLNEKGNSSLKLGGLLQANGFPLDQAHDALADTRGTVALARYLRDRAPDVWDHLFACRSRHAVEAILQKNELVLFTDRAFGKPTILAGLITRHPDNAAEIAMFDLAYDPTLYLDVDHERAMRLLKSSPRPIRTMRANSLPILRPLGVGIDLGVDPVTAHERLTRIHAHPGFASTIAKAMAARYEDAAPAAHVEQRIYDGFPSRSDEQLMDKFHSTPWEARFPLVEHFEDGRFRELAERVIYNERPEALPADRRAALDAWRRERLTASGETPWLTLSGARAELVKLRASVPVEDVELLDEAGHFFSELEAELGVERTVGQGN